MENVSPAQECFSRKMFQRECLYPGECHQIFRKWVPLPKGVPSKFSDKNILKMNAFTQGSTIKYFSWKMFQRENIKYFSQIFQTENLKCFSLETLNIFLFKYSYFSETDLKFSLWIRKLWKTFNVLSLRIFLVMLLLTMTLGVSWSLA